MREREKRREFPVLLIHYISSVGLTRCCFLLTIKIKINAFPASICINYVPDADTTVGKKKKKKRKKKKERRRHFVHALA